MQTAENPVRPVQKIYPVIGRLKPHLIGDYLGTGFKQFSTGLVMGLAKVTDDGHRLEVLAIVSAKPGKGHFRAFVRAAKEHYKAIRFLDVVSLQLDKALDRYGFALTMHREEGAVLPCRDWEAP